jgi:hypothetical protein
LLITTQRSLMARCPLCGRLGFHPLSLFHLNETEPLRISCGCGFEKLVIQTKGREITLQAPCLLCEELHSYKYNKRQMGETALLGLKCTETGQELGFFGTISAIDRLVRSRYNDLESIINNNGFEEYFSNPPVMLGVLHHLQAVAKEEFLYCHCGNHQIAVNIFPEKLELQCPDCQSLYIIYAETREDLQAMQEVQTIAMAEKGFTSCNTGKANPDI